MRTFLGLIVAISLLVSTPLPLQAGPTPRKGAARLKCSKTATGAELMTAVVSKVRGRSFSAKFCQLYTDRVLGPRPEECGTLLAHPDGRVRFVYNKPAAKTFVFDGKKAIFIEPDAAQVTYVDGFGHSPMADAMALMWGQGAWEKAFTVRGQPRAGDTPDTVEVVLIAEGAREQIERLEVSIHVARCEVVSSKVIDKIGNITRYRLFETARDVPISEGAFALEVPKDFSVLHAPQ